jgi:cytoskeletal protein RodZ
MENDIVSIVLFAIIGYLTSFFSKNMIIILVIAVVFTNVLKYGANITREGAANMSDSDSDSSSSKKDSKSSDSDKSTGKSDKSGDSDKSTSKSDKSSDSSKKSSSKEGIDGDLSPQAETDVDKHQKLANNIASVLKAFDTSKK